MAVRKISKTSPEGKKYSYWIVDRMIKSPNGLKKRIRVHSPYQGKKGALQYEREILENTHNFSSSSFIARESILLKDFTSIFIEKYVLIHNKPTEIRAKKQIFRNHIIPFLGSFNIDKIGSIEIYSFIQHLSQKSNMKSSGKLSPKSINNILSVLHKILSFGEELGVVSNVPKIKWLKVMEKKQQQLSVSECHRIAEVATLPWSVMFQIAFRTGMRKGELRALQWSDIDFDNLVINVQRSYSGNKITSPKSNRLRQIPFTETTESLFKALLPRKGMYVFSGRSGSPLSLNNMARKLYKACDDAGIKRVGYHALRRAMTTTLAERAVDSFLIQNICGHVDIRTTMKYINPNLESLRAAVHTLEEPWQKTWQKNGCQK